VVSSKTSTEPSRLRIITVLGATAIVLFASLIATELIGNSTQPLTGVTAKPTSIQKSYEAFIDSRTKQLPEVQTFLHLYPNATMKNYYLNEYGAQYDLSSTVPSIHLDDNYFIEAVDLTVYVD
jgi:hypothetical protein